MNRFLGLIILAIIALGVGAYTFFDFQGMSRKMNDRSPTEISLYFGGEKSDMLQNPKIKKILHDKYKISLDARKAGSIEMVSKLPHEGQDCLWPSNMVAVELAKKHGLPVISDETIFNSPMVFYAWADVASALVKNGVVEENEDGFLSANVNKIGLLVKEKARWKEDLGLNVYGTFKIFSTDPTKSNSGNIWSGLLATILNKGVAPTVDTVGSVLPDLTDYFESMGHMEASSGDIFQNFLKQGMGARPIIVGYENQMVEFISENAAMADSIRDKVRVIYPEPTIFASHPLIALSEECSRLSEALLDPDVQAIAWSDHGFRTGLIGVENNPGDIEGATLPETIGLVAPMPSAGVMEAIITALE